MEGSGRATKGFKSEWATVKDGLLYVGSMGKEWSTPQGEVLSSNPLWVKTLDTQLRVNHFDWSANFQKLRAATGATHPGYLMHEACVWVPTVREWWFLPRRHSEEPYDEKEDETRGTNFIIRADEHFTRVKASRLGVGIVVVNCSFLAVEQKSRIFISENYSWKRT